jgi:hypothetical protein
MSPARSRPTTPFEDRDLVPDTPRVQLPMDLSDQRVLDGKERFPSL